MSRIPPPLLCAASAAGLLVLWWWTPPAESPGDPAPGPNDSILVDARTSFQHYTTLAEAERGVPLTDPSGRFSWTNDMDGAGTHALVFELPSWDGTTCLDGGGHYEIPMRGNPTRLFFQWKMRMGRTATGGGIGPIGSAVINNPRCSNAGRKLVLFARNVPDLGGRGRVDYVWPGPAPAVPRFEGFYGTGAADRTILPNQGVYFPQQHVGETITQTIEMQAESRPGGRDGVLRLWIDGRLLTNATGVALGTEGVNRVLIPSTFRASAQDQTEYYWAFLAWTPKS